MTEKTITLRAELVDQLEALASARGSSIDEVVAHLLEPQVVRGNHNWALALAEAMESEDIVWLDETEGTVGGEA